MVTGINNALGVMEKDEQGKISMTKVTLRPHAIFSSEKKPSLTQLEKCTIKRMSNALSPIQ